MSTALTIRHLQFYAAVCLCRYGNSRHVSAIAFADLVSHLISMFTAADITEWEQRGTQLEMGGRGDEIPDDVLKDVPEGEHDLFFRLVEYGVSVGITDMYGALTDAPKKCLEVCFGFLHQAGLDTRDIRDRLAGSPAIIDWGEPISVEQLAQEVDRYPECKRYLRLATQGHGLR